MEQIPNKIIWRRNFIYFYS